VPGGGGTVESEINGAIKAGALFPYVGKTERVYRCPSDKRMRDPRQTAYRSFSIANGANGETGWPDNGADHTPAKKYSEIRNPSVKYIFLEDIDPRGSNVGSWQFHFQPFEWIDPVAMWHAKRTTFSFGDGHAEMHKWHDKYFIDWANTAMYSPTTFVFNKQPEPGQMTDITFARDGFPSKSHR
jgi:prepilin-type processing-associated H-X9-DG protein